MRDSVRGKREPGEYDECMVRGRSEKTDRQRGCPQLAVLRKHNALVRSNLGLGPDETS